MRLCYYVIYVSFFFFLKEEIVLFLNARREMEVIERSES